MADMTALDGLIGGIRALYENGVEQTFKRGLDFVDLAESSSTSEKTSWVVAGIRGTPIEDASPSNGEALVYNSTTGELEWVAVAVASIPVAATVFVDGDNGTSGGVRGDAMSPFDTISHGLSAMQTGDTLRVRPGTYSESVTLPDLDTIHVVLERGVTITSSGAATITRSSSTAMSLLTIDGAGASIYNTHASGTCISLNGSSVSTPGYDVVIIADCVIVQTSDQKSIDLTCVGDVTISRCLTNGGATLDIDEVGKIRIEESNTGIGSFSFNTRATLPNGYSSGSLDILSSTVGNTTLSGSLSVEIDGASSVEACTSTRSAGSLLLHGRATGLLTINDTGVSDVLLEGAIVYELDADSAVEATGCSFGAADVSAASSFRDCTFSDTFDASAAQTLVSCRFADAVTLSAASTALDCVFESTLAVSGGACTVRGGVIISGFSATDVALSLYNTALIIGNGSVGGTGTIATFDSDGAAMSTIP